MNLFRKIFNFYYEGFRDMTVGKRLWLIILIKVFIMFAILKVFFFRGYLSSRYDTPQEKSEHVIKEITRLPE